MAEVPGVLPGQGSVSELVLEFAARSGRGSAAHSRRSPVLILTGPRGVGKTRALERLAADLDQRVPYAFIDCQGLAADTRELLSALDFELNRHCGRYGRLWFPRFETGQAVVTAQLDGAKPRLAREEVKRVVDEYGRIARMREATAAVAKQMGKVVPHIQVVPGAESVAESVAKAGLGLAVTGLLTRRTTRRFVLGEGQDWYGHQDRGLGRDPLDELVDLGRMADRPDQDGNRAEVTKLLMAAFLADLRANFRWHLWRASDWAIGCVVLLDNVDTPAGRRLIAELHAAQSQWAAHAPGDPDPLTVVCASRGQQAAQALRDGQHATPLAAAGYRDYLSRSQDELGDWSYPVLLPNLTETEAADLAKELKVPAGVAGGLAAAVHGFTDGHPGMTYALLAAQAARPKKSGDLRSLLDEVEVEPESEPESESAPGAGTKPEPIAGKVPDTLPDPDAGSGLAGGGTDASRIPAAGKKPTVSGKMLATLLEGQSPQMAEQLITCAAARHLDEASRLAARSGLLDATQAARQSVFPRELQQAGPGSGPAVLVPVLRRLLARELAARPAGAATGWVKVHGWLKENPKPGDEIAELYHALALGEVEYVARNFDDRLNKVESGEWLRQVYEVTAAPNPLDHSQAANAHFRKLIDWVDPREQPLGSIGRLIAALWLQAEPLAAGPRRELLLETAVMLNVIAGDVTEGSEVLRIEAVKYQNAAELSA